jgi:hypothetical protein
MKQTIRLNESQLTKIIKESVKRVLRENEFPSVATQLISKDWDELYEEAHEEPISSKIKSLLVKIFKDKKAMIAIGDNYEWSDGSNGFISFSQLDHFITDAGYQTYAENPDSINNIQEFKKELLYRHASPVDGENRKGQKYKNKNYNPNNNFSW